MLQAAVNVLAPAPGAIAAEIVEDLEAALEEFPPLAESLEGIGVDIEAAEGVEK